MKIKVLLYGYAGHKNFGDDLLLKLAVESILSYDISISIDIATNNQKGVAYLKAWFPNCNVLFSRKWDRKLFSKYNKAILFGGGVYFNSDEKYSYFKMQKKRLSAILNYGIPYYLGTRFASIGLGIGPFVTDNAEKASLAILKYQDIVIVRDQKSYSYANKFFKKKLILADDVSLAEFRKLQTIRRGIESNRVIIVLRNYKYNQNKNSYVNTLVGFADYLKSVGKEVVWCSFQPEYDQPAMDIIKSRTEEVWLWEPEAMVIDDLYRFFSTSCFIVTARMHGIFISGMLGIPVVGIGVHPKLQIASSLFKGISTTVASNPSNEELRKAYLDLNNSRMSDLNDLNIAYDESKENYRVINEWIKG